jgi:two-component system LytT family response regulator/two-component system response regulator LytT
MSVRATPAIPTILADDEAPALDELAYLLREFPEIDIVGQARNGLQALEMIRELEPDLVFLDVQMPGLDGLGVVKRLRELQAPVPAFVLCTAYEQYALEAFEEEALDYLLKPVEKERLGKTVDRVRRSLLDAEESGTKAPVRAAGEGGEGDAAAGPVPVEIAQAEPLRKLLVRSAGKNLVVDAGDVVYATIEDGTIRVVTTTLEGQANFKTIEEMQASLDPAQFWRAHRSYLVNVNRIKEVIPWFKSSYQIRMDDRKGTEVPVSRVQTKRLRGMFRL